MNLEQQVCSLDLAKRLKELGVKQESLLCWDKTAIDGGYQLMMDMTFNSANAHLELRRTNKAIAAFTVAELGERVPASIKHKKGHIFLLQMSRKDGTPIWDVGYMKWNNQSKFDWADVEITQRSDTEADARAKMLIYLLENKLIVL